MLPEKADDFEDRFDRLRRDGEILLLIVDDGIHPSAERLVQWMNTAVGSTPYKLGLVQLRLYDLPEAGRWLIVPEALLRIREASRHVVMVNVQGVGDKEVTVTTSAPDERSKKRKIAPPAPPLTEERLTELIGNANPLEIVDLTDALRSRLKVSGLKTRGLPSTIQYGVEIEWAEFITSGVDPMMGSVTINFV